MRTIDARISMRLQIADGTEVPRRAPAYRAERKRAHERSPSSSIPATTRLALSPASQYLTHNKRKALSQSDISIFPSLRIYTLFLFLFLFLLLVPVHT